jgi:hypothetical protein
MHTLTVEPSRKYLTKIYVVIAIVAVGIVLCGLLIGGLLSLDETIGVDAIWWTLGVTLGLNVGWYRPSC